MNFLAHIYLSGDNELVKIGNFMADGIRGKDYLSMPDDVQKGILLHRSIDVFTDTHPIFRESTHRLHPSYHHYAGVIVDVFYDHFLAKNWSLYSDVLLKDFVSEFYNSLQNNYEILSERTKGMMPYMIKYNWLLSYQTVDGIANILTQMDHRTKNASGMRLSVNELKTHYEVFESEFFTFFDDVVIFSKLRLTELY